MRVKRVQAARIGRGAEADVPSGADQDQDQARAGQAGSPRVVARRRAKRRR